MSLGPIEVFVLFALMIFWIAPVAILIAIANNKGRSKHFAWWGVGQSAGSASSSHAASPVDRL